MESIDSIINQLQQTPLFREPSSAEIDGACLRADPNFNFMSEAERAGRRNEARQWLRAWKNEARIMGFQAPELPKYKPRHERRRAG